LVKGTGVEISTEAGPKYLRWFFGLPLLSWAIGIAAIVVAVSRSELQLVPAVVLVECVLNSAATVRVLVAQAGHLRILTAQFASDGDRPPPISSVHEGWRARSACWAYLASLLALFFLALIRFLPTWAVSDLFPMSLVPLYELALLALTVTIIAVLSQYTARAASADAKLLSGEFRRYSGQVARASLDASSRLSDDLSVLTGRLVEATTKNAQDTSEALRELARSVGLLAEATSAQNEVVRGAIDRVEGILVETKGASERNAEAVRRSEERAVLAAAEEVRRLRPRVAVRLRVQGTLIHHVWLDLYDGTSPAVGVVAEVTGGKARLSISLGNLGSRVPRQQDLEDIKFFPYSGEIRINLQYSDTAGRPYRGSVSFRFSRSEGLFGVTSGWEFIPDAWQWVEAGEDLPRLPA